MGELWCVFYGDFSENRLHYNDTALYIVPNYVFVTNGAPDLDYMPAILQIFPISTRLFAYPTSVYVIGNFVDINDLVQM